MRVVPEIWNQAIVYLPPKQGAAFFVLKKKDSVWFHFFNSEDEVFLLKKK